MKNFLFGTILVLISTLGIAQTNTFPSSGNVGVGTISPTSKLQIYNDVNGPVWLGVYNNSTASNSVAGIKLGMGDSYDIGTNLYHKKLDNTFYFENLGAPDSRFAFLTRKADGTYGEVALGINGNGNVGIGTTNPDRNLSILSAESSYLNLRTDNGYEFLIGADINGGIISTMSNHDLSIRAGSNSTKMTVKTNGNIGIGTINPDSKLTVKGKIHAEEVKIDLSVPAPDYVFTKDYDLLTIEEIQQHIKEKGHLPNIPSASEMEKNGVALGVMNMKLLEKIEELTLYTIAQENKLNEQETRLKTLENKLALLIKK
ncbi:hypothetical protein IWQ47_004414 [Aquimarina sp. EL_43]|uniref:tail fiber protein n=1 Tax=unclassified Aquimarina TaxID=2627091 RepID=UPI0018C921CA|nr:MULTISPECIES: tail fiber protein [unclassified Aquimarina]MBG6132756.1 hypothetical protein [Aquimarina sp. EL_35]MBG6153167.1 hypothetical protein [Aquimarina sp. EL_32]MBG6171323.1 hypothetical protein [Aquimarina sp. EL_43]